MPTDRTYSLLLTLDDDRSGNARRLVASVVFVDDHGDLYAPSDHGSPEDAALADFCITAYLDSSEDHAWGFFHGYQKPYLVDLDRAETIVRTLRKIAKGLDKATTEQGHVTDFADYLFRVAKILRIRSFYLRNSDRRREITGQTFSQVDPTGVQHWVREQEQQHGKQPTHAG